MKRKALGLILTLLFSAIAGTQLVNFATANPLAFPYGGDVPPDSSTKPPAIAISSTSISGNNVSINFKASVGESTTAYCTYISKVYYIADWDQNQTYIYQFYDPEENIWDTKQRTDFSYELNITAIPVEGIRTITVYALEEGGYLRNDYVYGFSIVGFLSVNFTIDTTPPKITVKSVKNVTYDKSDLPLNFTTSEPTSKISYVLDNQDNVTINGNTTLTGLSEGVHTITIYAWDAAGNIGSSETITFSMAEPEIFPTVPVAAASVASVAAIGVGLLVYFKKRKR